MSVFSKLWAEFIEWIESIGKDTLDFIAPLAKEISKNGGDFLIQVAYKAVVAAEANGGSGSDKFNAAKNSVVTALAAEGLPIVLNAVHGALEAAVAKMKAGV